MSDGMRLAEQIIEEFDAEVGKSAAVQNFYKLASQGNATYREANEAAKEIGKILARAYQKYLGPEQMQQEQVVYELAREILSPTMYHDHETVSEIAAKAQENMNKKAGIGIKAIRPEFDQSKVDSLAGRIAKEEKFEDVSWIFDAPIRNFTQSIVDQTAKANMEFQGKAGLRPVVVRRTSGRCCAWCLALAGTYEYPGAPKDVFRRHNNCNCTVECNPRGGNAFQNVWNKNEWRYEKDQDAIAERLALEKTSKRRMLSPDIEDVTAEYIRNAKPKSGTVSIDQGVRNEDKEISEWLHKKFGGDIHVLKDVNKQHIKTPDAFWNGKYWEYKNPKTRNAIDKRLKDAVAQLGDEEGGIVLDITGSTLSREESINVIIRRLPQRLKRTTDVIVKDKDALLRVMRYKKEE